MYQVLIFNTPTSSSGGRQGLDVYYWHMSTVWIVACIVSTGCTQKSKNGDDDLERTQHR